MSYSKNKKTPQIEFNKILARKNTFLNNNTSCYIEHDDDEEITKSAYFKDPSTYLRKPMRNKSIQMDKQMPRKFLVDEKKLNEFQGKQIGVNSLNRAYESQGHVRGMGTNGLDITKYSYRGVEGSALPFFMQKINNR